MSESTEVEFSEFRPLLRGGPLDGTDTTDDTAHTLMIPLDEYGRVARMGDPIAERAVYRRNGLHYYYVPD